MTRRRVVMLGAGVVAAASLVLVPSAGSGSPGRQAPPDSAAEGKGPKGQRCDPQPDRGNGPPAGKGKKCASP